MSSYYVSRGSIYEVEPCRECHGGRRTDRCNCAGGFVGRTVTCMLCSTRIFTGHAPRRDCSICHGTGITGKYGDWRMLPWVSKPHWIED